MEWWQKARSWSGLSEAMPAQENTFAEFWHGNIDRANAWEREQTASEAGSGCIAQ